MIFFLSCFWSTAINGFDERSWCVEEISLTREPASPSTSYDLFGRFSIGGFLPRDEPRSDDLINFYKGYSHTTIPMALSGAECSMYTRFVRAMLDHLTIMRSSYYDRPQRSSRIPVAPVFTPYCSVHLVFKLYTPYGVKSLVSQCGIPRGKALSRKPVLTTWVSLHPPLFG